MARCDKQLKNPAAFHSCYRRIATRSIHLSNLQSNWLLTVINKLFSPAYRHRILLSIPHFNININPLRQLWLEGQAALSIAQLGNIFHRVGGTVPRADTNWRKKNWHKTIVIDFFPKISSWDSFLSMYMGYSSRFYLVHTTRVVPPIDAILTLSNQAWKSPPKPFKFRPESPAWATQHIFPPNITAHFALVTFAHPLSRYNKEPLCLLDLTDPHLKARNSHGYSPYLSLVSSS